MRLIDADALVDCLKNKGAQIIFDLPVEEVLGEDIDLDDFAMLVQDAVQAYKKMVLDTIKNQPTAYDVEKVIEQLEKELELADEEKKRCVAENPLQFDSAKGYATGISNALEIVREGGKE